MKRLRFLVIWVALAVLFPCGAVAAESWPADAPAVPERVRRLMQDRNYAEARQGDRRGGRRQGRAEGLPGVSEGPGPVAAEAIRRGRGRVRRDAEGFSQEPVAPPRAVRQGGGAGPQGRFPRGRVIVRAEAEYLLSADRKQQIADIYLEFADALFKPPKDDAEARLRQGVGVLPEGAGSRAEAGEADRGGIAGGRVPAESGEVRRGDRALREVHQGSSPLVKRH